MAQTVAINIALTLMKQPTSARRLGRGPLPDGITDLLAIASGHPEALRVAEAQTEQTAATLRSAAAFFIEQVMFTEYADSYRILGASAGAQRSILRRHMVLLMNWLHPDTQEQRAGWDGVDRSVFIHRVIRAWSDLKNDDRRGEYDRRLGEQPPHHAPAVAKPENIPHIFTPLTRAPLRHDATRHETQRFRRLVMFRLQHALLPSRLLSFLRDRQ